MAFYFKEEGNFKAIVYTGTILIIGDASFREFEECLFTLARNGTKQITIDFSDCIYLDSNAIRVIISVNRRLKAYGGVLKIQNANQEINELLLTIQLNRIIEMVVDPDNP